MKASELASSTMTCRILSLVLILCCEAGAGNSWNCTLASEGSVRGAALEAALHVILTWLSLIRQCNMPLTVHCIHTMTRALSKQSHV